jgi:hypothetical protein
MRTQTTPSTADLTCAHCGEPWNVDGLRHEAVEYLDGARDALLAPLGENVVAAFNSYWNVTVGAAFNPGWSAAADADARACAEELNAAVYRATLSGKGCPSCGWAHTGTGRPRKQQLTRLVGRRGHQRRPGPVPPPRLRLTAGGGPHLPPDRPHRSPS